MWGLIALSVVVLVLGAWFFGRRYVLYRRREKVRKFIREFAKDDPFWNEQNMLTVGKEMFAQVQYAWVKKEIYPVGDYITEELKKEWLATWIKMIEQKQSYNSSRMDISHTTIIGAENYWDNEKDAFSMEITGYVKRYFWHVPTKELLEDNTAELELITDIFFFIRRGNKWMLKRIHRNAKMDDILHARIFNEKPGKPEDT